MPVTAARLSNALDWGIVRWPEHHEHHTSLQEARRVLVLPARRVVIGDVAAVADIDSEMLLRALGAARRRGPDGPLVLTPSTSSSWPGSAVPA